MNVFFACLIIAKFFVPSNLLAMPKNIKTYKKYTDKKYRKPEEQVIVIKQNNDSLVNQIENGPNLKTLERNIYNPDIMTDLDMILASIIHADSSVKKTNNSPNSQNYSNSYGFDMSDLEEILNSMIDTNSDKK